jgi:hypothetical protein
MAKSLVAVAVTVGEGDEHGREKAERNMRL